MKRKYAIIRRQAPAAFDPFEGALAGAAAARPAAVARVDVEDLDSRDVARLRQHADVDVIAPEMPTKLITPVKSVDGEFLQPAASTNTWGIEAVAAHTSPLGGQGINVAVLDTGIDINHPAFNGVNIEQEDFTGDGNGDVDGHGTHCAGTVFGQNVNNRRIGVARSIDKALIGKVLGNDGSGSSIWSFQGITWALENGANVISMSLGIDFPGYVSRLVNQGVPVDFATNLALEGYRATINAYTSLAVNVRSRTTFGQHCVVVAAAGNENRPFTLPTAPTVDWDINVGLPAATTGILSVAAIGQTSSGLKPASFSNSGANVSGPGVGVISAEAGTGGLVAFNGTSMATPHIAGVAALWAQWLKTRGQLSPFNIDAKLSASANTNGFVSGVEPADIGLGMVQAPQNA